MFKNCIQFYDRNGKKTISDKIRFFAEIYNEQNSTPQIFYMSRYYHAEVASPKIDTFPLLFPQFLTL